MSYILIVEDNEINAKMMIEFLRFKKYKVRNIFSGLEVIPTLEEKIPNLILMDIQLFGMSGIEAAKIVKENKKFQHIPIIAISAFSIDKFDKIQSLIYFDEFIEKPIKFTYFEKIITKYVLLNEC